MAVFSPPTVQQRIKFVFLLSCVGVLVALFAMKVWNDGQDKQTLAQYSRDRQDLVNQILTMESATTDRMMVDYAVWTDLQDYLRRPSPSWAKENVDSVLDGYNLNGLWILDQQGNTVYTSTNSKLEAPIWNYKSDSSALPVGAETKKSYVVQDGVLREVRAVRFRNGDTGALLPGYYVTEADFGTERTAQIGKLLGGTATVQFQNAQQSPRESTDFSMSYPLQDANGNQVATLSIVSKSPLFQLLHQRSTISLVQFGTALGILALIMLVSLNQVVTLRKDDLSKALANNDADILIQNAGNTREIEEMADLIGVRAEKEQLKEINLELEGQVLRKTVDLQATAVWMVERWLDVLEARPDFFTEEQNEAIRVTDEFGRFLGYDEDRRTVLRRGTLLYYLENQPSLVESKISEELELAGDGETSRILAMAKTVDLPWVDTKAKPGPEACALAVVKTWFEISAEEPFTDSAVRRLKLESGHQLDAKMVNSFLQFMVASNRLAEFGRPA